MTTIVTLVEGQRFELAEDAALDNREWRWAKPSEETPWLHKGRFIIDVVSSNEIYFADADWDENGLVTFHSTKHGHVVKGKRNIAALKKLLRTK
jgi:hypothetical protein